MLYITNNRKTDYVIVYRKDHTPSEETAALELASYLEKITGVKFPVVTDDAKKTDCEIVVGFASRPGCKKIADLGEEGFTIKTDGKRLLILGSEVRGALYGVYTFLEKYCGCRFYTENCERVPKLGENVDLEIPGSIDHTEKPVFEYRNVYWSSLHNEMVCAKLKNNGGMGHEITEKVGGSIDYNGDFCHTITRLAETGNFWDMPCLSDENVYQTTLKNVKADLRAHPEKKIISVSQVDGLNGECSCEKCRKVYEEEKSHMGTLLRFVNRIQEDIKDEFPDAVVDTLAYRFTRKPPAVTKPHKDMIIRLCNIECCFRHPLGECENEAGTDEYDTFPENLKKWNEITNKLYIWDYTTNFANMTTAFPNFEALRKNVRFFAENGVVGMFEQGNIGNPNGEFGEIRAYLLAKLLWNPYMTESEFRGHMMDFANDFYGEGAKYIIEYIDLMHACSKDSHMTIYFDNSANIIYMDGYKTKLDGAFAFYDKGSELFDLAEAATWTSGNRFTYDNVRRSRIQLYNYNNFILKSRKDQATSEEMRDVIEHAIVDNNREQFVLMRELGITEPREFAHIDYSKPADFHGYALWW